jgi:predicted Zn-dependent protease
MKRRHLLAAGCAQCAGLWAPRAFAQAELPADWAPPERFQRPEVASDEGGLWAMMDREETRLRRSPFVIRDAALRDYLSSIACKLAGSHCQDVRVYPVRTPFFNASMAPNGMMQVWSGLLLRVDNEAQLAAVIGHEMGHYMQRHLVDRLRDIKSRSAFATFMAAFGVVGMVGQLAAAASAMSFSRDQERQADSIGIVLMRNAGYDPREASKVWTNLQAELAATPGGDPTKTSPMFASHPPSDERSAALARLAESANGGFVGESEFEAKLAPFQFDLLSDELKRGQHGETLALLDRLVQRSPKRPDLYYFRAETRRLRAKDNDLDNAMVDLQQAVALGGEPAQVHRSMGYIEQKLGHGAQANAAFTRYIERMPNAPDADLIRSYISEGKS